MLQYSSYLLLHKNDISYVGMWMNKNCKENVPGYDLITYLLNFKVASVNNFIDTA